MALNQPGSPTRVDSHPLGYLRTYLTFDSAAAHEYFIWRNLANVGVAAPLVMKGSDWFVSAPGIVLSQWRGDRGAMKQKVLSKISLMHDVQVCHRDLHAGNVVVIRDEPFFIDFYLATMVSRMLACYDLYGPSIESVVAPKVHAGMNLSVWWDCKQGKLHYPTLGEYFGPLKEDG